MGVRTDRHAELSPRTVGLAVAAVVGGVGLGTLIALTSPLVALGVVAGVGAALAILTSVEVGFAALILVATLLPFAAIPVNVGFYPTFLDGALGGLLIVWFVRAFSQPEERLEFGPLGGLLLVFIALATVSFVFGTQYSQSKDTIRRFGEIMLALVLYYVVINNIWTRDLLRRLVALVIVGGGVAAIMGIILDVLPVVVTERLLGLLTVVHYYPEGQGIIRYINDDPDLPRRATATAVDPNVLGGMLVLTTALALSQLFSRRPVLARTWLVPLTVAMLICMPLTFSRGSWAGLAAAALVMATVRYRRMWFFFALGGLAVYAFVPQADMFIGHLISGAQFQDRAAAMRLGEYKDAIRLISEYPVFGIGFGAAPSIDLYRGVSNVYLLIAEQTGLVGLSAFLLVIARFLWYAFGCLGQVRDVQLSGIILGLASGIAGALIAGIFDHYFFNLDFPHTVALFWLFVGLTVVAIRLDRQSLPAVR